MIDEVLTTPNWVNGFIPQTAPRAGARANCADDMLPLDYRWKLPMDLRHLLGASGCPARQRRNRTE